MGFWSTLGMVAGGIGGAIFGGPAGASIGASLGGGLGGWIDDKTKKKPTPISDEEALYSTQKTLGQFGLTDKDITQMYRSYQPEMFRRYNQSGNILGFMTQNAMSPELSHWANASIRRQMLEQGTQRENLDKQLAGQTAGTLSSLAAKGGLSTGARERAMTQLGNQRLAELQALNRAGMIERAKIGETDMGRKQTMLQSLPSQYMALGQAENNFYNNLLRSRLAAKEKAASLWADIKTNTYQNQ